MSERLRKFGQDDLGFSGIINKDPVGSASYREQAATLSDEDELISTIPPNTGLESDDKKHFEHVYDQNSGEAERITTCSAVLLEVAQAVSNRELDPQKSFENSIFLMPFPRTQGNRVLMEVRSFDHEDTTDPLYEISTGLLGLTSFRDAETKGILTRDERINLVKALTKYFADLKSHPVRHPGINDMQIDFTMAIDTLNKMEWANAAAGKNGAVVHYLGRKREVQIGVSQLNSFKMKMGKYFLEKIQTPAAEPLMGALPDTTVPLKNVTGFGDQGSFSKLLGKSRVEALRNSGIKEENPGEVAARKAEIVEHRVGSLKEMAKNFLEILTPFGETLETMTALTLIGELALDEQIDFEVYITLFRTDERDARLLARAISRARVELAAMDLSSDILYIIMTQFLTKRSFELEASVLVRMADRIK